MIMMLLKIDSEPIVSFMLYSTWQKKYKEKRLPPVKWTTPLPAKSWYPQMYSHPSGCQAQCAMMG